MKKTSVLLLTISILLTLNLHAQMQRVTGRVINVRDKTPLPGVSVVAKGTTLGTITDPNGEYQLDIPAGAGYLIFRFTGMKHLELPVKGQHVEVMLEPESIAVEEVLIVAYGTSRRDQFTGSASTIRPAAAGNFHHASVTQSLHGLAPGLQVATPSGQPGENSDIRIRGISTFGNSSPLIVVDGFPFDGNLHSLPANDIETITILKDAVAAALYGSRAANGVIMVTTRTGPATGSRLSIQASYGIKQRAMPEYDRVSSAQWYELMWETMRNMGIEQGKTPQAAAVDASAGLIHYIGGYNAYNVADNLLVDTEGRINTAAQPRWKDNWQKELFDMGRHREITVNAGGQLENGNYYASAAALNDQGIIRASGFNRYSARLNINNHIREWLDFGMNLSGSISDQNYPLSAGGDYSNPFLFSRQIAPVYPVYLYDLQGNLQQEAGGSNMFDFGSSYGRARPYAPNVNPLGTIHLNTRLYRSDSGTARSYLSFRLADNLFFKVSASADLHSVNQIFHENQQYGPSAGFKGRSARESSRTLSFSSNQLLSYSLHTDRHRLQLLAGHESYASGYTTLMASRTGFPFPGMIELAAASVPESSGSFENNHRIESYLAKADYQFAGKYSASASIRADGNSIFHEDTRWGSFWSLGIAWNLAKEEFMGSPYWLNTLRIKTSYGQQGNDKIGTLYAYQGLYATGWNNLNYPGLIASRLPTPELTWESLGSFNAGIEAVILHRLNFELEYYIRNNDNLLFAQPLAPSTGFTSIDANIASLQNKGVDMAISGRVLRAGNLEWDVTVNLSHYTNTIKKLPGGSLVSGNKRWEEGRSVYDFWLQDWAGVNPENGKAMWFKDEVLTVNGVVQYGDDGKPLTTGNRLTTEKYSEAVRYYAGSAIPDLMGAVINHIRFKGFDLSAVTSFGIGGKIYDSSYMALMHAGNTRGNHWHTDILDRWTSPGQVTAVPALNGSPDVIMQSTRYLTRADYLSVRNITLGYSPGSLPFLTQSFTDAKVYLSADNALILSGRKGMDPQQSFTGSHGNQYVPVRTITLGIHVTF